MKRRNADTGKMRRPVKRTKITEGMYGNSLLYLKFVMLWATVVMADYMLEFRFEFLWPFWMMLRSVYDSFKYQGLAFSVFFICIALTSDMICFFFIPLQYIFFAATTYVWVQYVWYSFADKGICLPTVAICCAVVYVEGALAADRGGGAGGGGLELCRPLAAHCVGYPVVTLGFGVKSYVGHRLRLRRQKQVRAENEFYFQLMKDALPESALEQNNQHHTKEERSASASANGECRDHATPAPAPAPAPASAPAQDARHMNGSLRRKQTKTELANGSCLHDTTVLQTKQPDKTEKHLQEKPSKAQANAHAHSNGTAHGATDLDDARTHEHSKGSKSKCEKKEASTLKEEKRKNKNRDKDKDNHSDSHKSTEQTKEQIVKEVESTKENHIRNHKECNSTNSKDRERERERDREKEKEMREKEREKERERERERELREARECAEELKRVRTELAMSRSAEAEAKRALAAAAAADRQRRQDYNQLKQAHQALQHKIQTWRSNERAALERRLGEERRARTHAETQLRTARQQQQQQNSSGECENSWCASRRAAQAAADAQAAAEAEAATLRRDLRRARERAEQLQRDLNRATEQMRSLEEESSSPSPANQSNTSTRLASACAALQERAAHLERSLSAETRVKLDLLSALGDAKRQMHIQEGVISRQEKEIEELKAQMLAVMPTEYVTPVSGSVSKLRLESSPLDPNASVYTPKQLCSDA